MVDRLANNDIRQRRTLQGLGGGGSSVGNASVAPPFEIGANGELILRTDSTLQVVNNDLGVNIADNSLERVNDGLQVHVDEDKGLKVFDNPFGGLGILLDTTGSGVTLSLSTLGLKATIAANAITYAMLPQVTDGHILGRAIDAGDGDTQQLDWDEARETLEIFDKVMTGDQTLSVSTTLTGITAFNPTHLEPSTYYRGMAYMLVNSHATPDIKFDLVAQSGLTSWAYRLWAVSDTVNVVGAANSAIAVPTNGVDEAIVLGFGIDTDLDDGLMNVEFAQNTSSKNVTTLYKFSHLHIGRHHNNPFPPSP